MAHLHKALSPYSRDLKVLAQSAKIYSRGKTPEVTRNGAVTELDVKPGGPELAARHVRELHRSGGASGMLDALRGLQITRGNQFVGQMFQHDAGMKELIQPRTTPAPVQTALESNETGRPIPSEQRDQFARATGHDPSGVRLFDNPAAHNATSAVGARAFTVGQRIFFNRGEYNPAGESGKELLMHELAHTVQQKGSAMPEARKLEVSTPGDAHERQAENVAQTVSRNGRKMASDGEAVTDEPRFSQDAVLTGSLSTARIQRAISFTTADHAPTTNAVVANETADGTGFQLISADPTFQWQPDVTIHGNAGDVFADWETAHHQVVKGFWENVFWGHGGAGGHRRLTINGALPMRDATAAGNTWYSDFRAQGFTADGDVRSPIMHDQPRTAVIPFNTPVAGKAGNSGTFNYGVGFVSTLSARHIPDGTGAGAFRHLNHMHWNFMLDGTFDAALAAGGRVNVTGGAVNHSKMIGGFDPANAPLPGGDLAIDHLQTTDT